MARILPRRFEPRTQNLLALTKTWAADPEAVGLTVARVAELRSAVLAARDRDAAARLARVEAESATAARAIAVAVMNNLTTAAVAVVKATTRKSGQEPTVLAGLPLPRSASHHATTPPPPVLQVTATPRADGSVLVEWAGRLTGTSYFEVERSIDGGGWTVLATRRMLTLNDATLPAGVKEAAYRVTPYRATRFTNGTIAGVGAAQTLKLGGATAPAPLPPPPLPLPMDVTVAPVPIPFIAGRAAAKMGEAARKGKVKKQKKGRKAA